MATESAASPGFGDRLRGVWHETWGRLPKRAQGLIPGARPARAAPRSTPSTTTACRPSVPVIQNFPSVSTAVIMIVFIMMAVGLNIVVGYCGLLDLGYVAFYAVGAYTAGWLASGHFQQVKIHLGSAGISTEPARHPHQHLGRPPARGLPDRARRHPHRAPDAAPARRLPGDRDARVRRDHSAVRQQRRRPRRASTSRPAPSGSTRSTRPASERR